MENKFMLLFLGICIALIDPITGQCSGGAQPAVAPCFSPRTITGCHGTLQEDFRPTEPYSGTNRPNTLLFLFTPKSPRLPEYLHDCGGRLPENTNFDSTLRTVIVVHGFRDGPCRTQWMREYVTQFLIRGSYNIILVDWTWGNSQTRDIAVANAKIVAETIAFVIDNIINQTGASASSFYMIGHSLGAHTSGYVGKRVKGLGRITALDPSLSPFKMWPPEDRLTRNDASLVDVIHTNAGNSSLFMGYDEPLGHADFYPNGGSVQLSCVPYILVSFLKKDFNYASTSLIPRMCSHLQSIQYYKVSINPCYCRFVGVECPDYGSFESGRCRSCGPDGSNCAVMGLDFENYSHKMDGGYHKYYLDTTLLCPYCDNSKIDLQGFSVRNQTTEYCRTTPRNNEVKLSSMAF